MRTLIAVPVAAALLLSLAHAGETRAATVHPHPDLTRVTSDTASLPGSWQGTLSIGGTSLRLVLHLVRGDDGALSATLDSPDQGARGIPAGSVRFAEGLLTVEIPAVGARLEAEPVDRDHMSARFHQGTSDFPLELVRVTGDLAPARPQNPEPPFPYHAEDVEYPNPGAGITLAGTLTVPEGAGPFPAVALISGSGAQDRNSEVFEHKLFLVLADHLTRRGIAVLRSDDRGVGASGGDFASATSADFATDAAAAVAYLRTRPEVDASAVGLVGMSEGGLIAPLVAVEHGGVDFLVLMAGPGVNGGEVVLRQSELISRANGIPEETIARNLAQTGELFRILREEEDAAVRNERLAAALRATFEGLTPEERAGTGIPAGQEEAWVQQQVAQLGSPWFRYFLLHEPEPVLRQVQVPVLALNGSLDLQVETAQNLPVIGRALREGGNPDFTTEELEGLNHLFQTARTGSPVEYGQIEETMSPRAMERVAAWILERFGR